jgi:hypothetical protein
LTRAVSSLLFGVTAADPVTFAASDTLAGCAGATGLLHPGEARDESRSDGGHAGRVAGAYVQRIPVTTGSATLLPTQAHDCIVLVDGDLQRLVAAADKLGGNRSGKIDRLIGRQCSYANHMFSRRNLQSFRLHAA